tara:strand:+ start:260 stop:535 length:276 start_codon:yes stop_codon:yes gene_type:complete
MKLLFELGAVVATPGAISLMGDVDTVLPPLIARHVFGDWGDLDEHDVEMNNEAVTLGNRILSSYKLPGDKKVWIITESDRSTTTILLPEEY